MKNQNLLNRLLNDSDSLDENLEDNLMSKGQTIGMGTYAGNPMFTGQFNLNVKTEFTEDGVVIAASALPAALKTKIATFLFGNSDFASDFAKSITFKTLTGWSYNATLSKIVGKEAKASSFAQKGDLELVFDGGTIGGKVYKAYVVINCPQVAYGTLLDSLSNDKMVLNTIRYKVDTTKTAQFSNQLTIIRQSLLGQTKNDDLDPNAYIGQGAFNANISEIPAKLGIDKYISVATYINYDVQELDFILFVAMTQKNEAKF